MPRLPRKWTAEEDEALRIEVMAQLAEGEAKDWCRIASKLPDRTNKDCRKRWHNAVAGGLKKGQWAKSEDTLLLRAVERHGQRWTLVAEEVRTRSADQCAKRYSQSLDPQLDRSEWSQQDNQLLLQAVARIGRHWKEIQKLHFPGRSKNCIKNRYTVLVRKIQNQGGNVDAYANLPLDADDDDEDDEDEAGSEYQMSETDSDFFYNYDSGIDSGTANSPTYSHSTRGSISYSPSTVPNMSWGADGSMYPAASTSTYSNAYYSGTTMSTAYDTSAYATSWTKDDLPTPTPQNWWGTMQTSTDGAVDPSLLQKGAAASSYNGGSYFGSVYASTAPSYTTANSSLGNYTMSASAAYGHGTNGVDTDVDMATIDESGNMYAAHYATHGQQSVKVTMTLKQPCTSTMTNLMKIAMENESPFIVERRH